jgi:hypothetical protein
VRHNETALKFGVAGESELCSSALCPSWEVCSGTRKRHGEDFKIGWSGNCENAIVGNVTTESEAAATKLDCDTGWIVVGSKCE